MCKQGGDTCGRIVDSDRTPGRRQRLSQPNDLGGGLEDALVINQKAGLGKNKDHKVGTKGEEVGVRVKEKYVVYVVTEGRKEGS